MIAYHVVIASERRVSTPAAPRQLALPVTTNVGVQLHTMGASISNIADTNIVYAATWDGVSPWVAVLKGSVSGLNMAYLGWPMIDQATWTLQNPVHLP